MYCPSCGTPNAAGAEKCKSCGNLLPIGNATATNSGQANWTPPAGPQAGQPGSQYNYSNMPPGSYNSSNNFGGYSPALAGQQPYYPPSYGTALARNYAGFWLRFGAYLIDYVIVSVVTGIIFLVPFFGYLKDFTSKYGDDLVRFCDTDSLSYSEIACGDTAEKIFITQGELTNLFNAVAIPMLIGVVVIYAYHIIMTARGGTLGKLAFGLRVIKEDGSYPGIGRALLRFTIGYLVSSLIFCLGYIWIGIDERKQGWHDKLSGTYVIRKN